MKIEEKIRLVVERMDKLTYRFCDLKKMNLNLDYDSLPAFVNVMPLTGSVQVTPTQIKNSPNCAFWIVDTLRMDADDEDIKEVTERCIDYAYEFILWLNESKMFEPVTDFNYTVVISDFDANVSGIIIEMKLKEKEGLRLCLDKNPNEYFHEQRGCEEGSTSGIGEPSEEDN